MTDVNERKVYRRIKLGPFEFVRDSVGSGTIDRWIIHLRSVGALRLHRINRDDCDRDFHDHRFDFTSLILSGGYVEHRPDSWNGGIHSGLFMPGALVRRRAEDAHRLQLANGPAWTIQLSGPVRRDWGFHTKHGWIAAEHYDFYAQNGERSLRVIRQWQSKIKPAA